MQLRKLSIEGTISFTIILIGFFSNYILHIFVARWLGVSSYGDFAIGLAVLKMTTMLALLGSSRMVIRFLPIYIANRKWSSAKGLLLYNIRLWLLGSVVTIAVASLIVFTQWLLQYDNNSSVHSVVYFLFLTPLTSACLLMRRILRANQNPFLSIFPGKILKPLLIVCFALILMHLYKVLSLEQLVLAMAFAISTIAIILIVIILQSLPSEVYKTTPHYDRKKWLQSSLFILTIGVLSLSIKRVELFTLELFPFPESTVGYFSALVTISSIIWLIHTAVMVVTAPFISTIGHTSNRQALQKLMNTINIYLILLLLPATTIMLVFSKNLLNMFGAQFAIYNDLLIILIIVTALHSLLAVSQIFLQLCGYYLPVRRVLVYSFLLNLLLALCLIPYFGLNGAVASLAISETIWSALMVFEAKRKLKLKPFYWF